MMKAKKRALKILLFPLIAASALHISVFAAQQGEDGQKVRCPFAIPPVNPTGPLPPPMPCPIPPVRILGKADTPWYTPSDYKTSSSNGGAPTTNVNPSSNSASSSTSTQ